MWELQNEVQDTLYKVKYNIALTNEEFVFVKYESLQFYGQIRLQVWMLLPAHFNIKHDEKVLMKQVEVWTVQ